VYVLYTALQLLPSCRTVLNYYVISCHCSAPILCDNMVSGPVTDGTYVQYMTTLCKCLAFPWSCMLYLYYIYSVMKTTKKRPKWHIGQLSSWLLLLLWNKSFKVTVGRKPRWVKIGINRKLFLYCLAADIYNFYLKGHYSLKYIKPVSAFNDHKN
jgi:hypothetical protein